MLRLVQRAHQFVAQAIRPGDWAVDATVGNGHDTLFLARCVGVLGHVWGFDIQPAAIVETRQRLRDSDCENVSLMESDHTQAGRLLPREAAGKIAAVMMNLGYLPGGDPQICTRAETTVTAIELLLPMLRTGGVASVLAYRGHPGGCEEAAAVSDLVGSLPADVYESRIETPSGTSAPAPQLFAVTKLAPHDRH